jgi:lipoprotein-anchoring transpeptidase ErfK/SrfK
MDEISRRDFLKYCGLGMVGLILPDIFTSIKNAAPPPLGSGDLLGRVTLSGHKLYQEPNFDSIVIEEMKKDSVRRITDLKFSADESLPNRIWYELDGKGFTHSGRVQPVRRQYNQAAAFIPEDGCLGEVTVPYVNAYSSMDVDRSIVYRFYYASTFWILARVVDSQENVWYQLLDDRYYQVFYIPAVDMRLVPDSELMPISPDVPLEEKKIVVDLENQSLTAFEYDRPVFMSRISSGVRLREGGFATPKGYYRTIRKRPCRHMANSGNAYTSGFDLPGVPWVSYFTSGGVAIHGAYWHNNFGVPHSHGCVNMTPQSAKWIYRWSDPRVPTDEYVYSGDNGTRVIVQ